MVGVLAPAPSHPFLIGTPCGERQKHNQKCSQRTFLARTFQLDSRHIHGSPFPQLASSHPAPPFLAFLWALLSTTCDSRGPQPLPTTPQ